MTVRETLAEGKRLLKSPSPLSFIDSPDLDAELLLAEILHVRREELLLRTDETLTDTNREQFLSLVERRRKGECIAYILGRKEFRGLDFVVNSNVLVPRPDTETLAEAALEYIDSWDVSNTPQCPESKNSFSVLDLCTCSGALAISLKYERPFLRVTASDISAEALEIAGQNSARLLDDNRNSVRFIQSDIFENIPDKFNIIVSNPPYIPTNELSTLAPEVQLEPRLALDGGADGLALIRKIISLAPEHLAQGGVLLIEAGPEQMPEIAALLEKNGFRVVRLHKDMAGRDRVISGSFKVRAFSSIRHG